MTFAQALVYFFREAFSSLVRSWKVSLVAIATIAMSLFLGGVFLLVSSNLRQVVERWQAEGKLVVYLEAEAGEAESQKLLVSLHRLPLVLCASERSHA
ncbi:MAG: hypothetical protein AAF560_04330 [Acidobacteriota bacterium]